MNTIMKDQNRQDQQALERYTLIAPLLDENLDPAKRSKLRKETAIKADISERTLYRYEAAYHEKGFAGLRPAACERSLSKKLLPQKHDKRIFRIKCDEDRRIFTPVARNSHKWRRLYKKRTGVERMNGRIDRDYRFERHTIRGLGKMRMFLTVMFLVYMGMAKGKIEKGQKEHLCRLYA